MDRFVRLTLWFVVGVLLSSVAVLSFADTVPSTLTWSAQFQGAYYATGSDANSACVATGKLVWPNGSAGNPGYGYAAAATTTPHYCIDTNGYTDTRASATSTSSCPANSTLTSGSCTCNTGYSALNGQCVASCTAHSGQNFSTGFYDMGTSPTAMPQHSGCDGGCGTSFNGTFPVSRALVGGVYHYFGQGSFVYDGSVCSGGTPSTSSAGASTPAPTCASGQSMGQVNGQTVCLGSGGTPTNPNTSPTPSTKTTTPTVTNPDGSTTQTSTQQNPDGSTTTTTTNTATNGTVTTSSTTTNPDGSTQDPMKGFCQQNPSSPMCKGQDAFCQANPNSIMCKDHTFSGSCAATSCSGDAIECAIAQEQAKRNCVLFDTTTPMSDLGNNVASGSDPQQSSINTMLAGTSTDVSTVFTTAQGSRWLGSADIPDVNITALGHSYVIPMSNWSNLFRTMGYILVSVSLVIAVRMVSSTVTA